MVFFVTFASEEAASPHESLPAETLFTIFGFPVSNSFFTGLIGYALIIWILFYVAGRVKKDNRNRFVSFVQWIFEALYKTVHQVIPDEKLARKVAPLSIAMFFFIIAQYYLGILPFAGPLTWHGVPIVRAGVADLNMTFALAIITIVAAQLYAIKALGAKGNLARYFRNPLKDPAGAFEGFLELIAEFSRMMALSFRLFGNVFAGEVLLMMIAFLTVYFAPVALPPCYAFEIFIGAIQAYIFFMLTTVFISLGASHAPHDDTDQSPADKPELAASGNAK